MMEISCSDCGSSYPPGGLPYCCPICGGLYNFPTPLPFDPACVDKSQPGIWRYRHIFGLSPDLAPVSLGEGNTPLVWVDVFERKIAFKCEFLNPSGSFKDRGSAVIVGWLKSRRISQAVEDSSGNAGASFAAYTARAGIKARVFVPESASGAKRRQIEAYGADLVQVPGTRTDVTEAVKAFIEGDIKYASHANLPFNLPGYATTAYEIYEQLGNRIPGAVILPAGQGGLLLGLAHGFESLHIAYNEINNIPRIVGVQAHACAPLWAIFNTATSEAESITENWTLAEGVRVLHPMRGDAVIRTVTASHGLMCVVDENEIIPSRDALAHLGFYVEPTSAIVWPALKKTIQDLPDPIVVILTGSGYKYDQDGERN